MLTDTDRRLLRRLQANPDMPVADLAEAVGLAPATCYKRLDRLQASGVIRATRAVIDRAALGYTVEVSLRITLDSILRQGRSALAAGSLVFVVQILFSTLMVRLFF